jgi:hypothetical protein
MELSNEEWSWPSAIFATILLVRAARQAPDFVKKAPGQSV